MPGKSPKTEHRAKSERLRTAKGRKLSSTLWLRRQINDPYVQMAKKEGYRSRAAYKLIELDDKFRFLKPGMAVLDLGAAPGGWTQVAVRRVQADKDRGAVAGIDLLEIAPIGHATLLRMDFMAADAPAALRALIPGGADIVLSDMAPNTTGHGSLDHMRIMMLLEAAYDFASETLKQGGAFVGKVFQGGAERELLARMKRDFQTVRHAKPKASRADSSEMYVVAMGFRRRYTDLQSM